MNKTEVNGKVKQIRGQLKVWQGQVTGNNLGQAAGKFDQLVGALQEKYGYNRERAEKELKRQMQKHQANGSGR